MSMLQFNGVHTHYGPIHVLKNVNYRVEQGEIVKVETDPRPTSLRPDACDLIVLRR